MSGRERGSALEDVGAQAREAWERQLRRQISRRRFGALAAAYFAGAIGIDALLAACGGSPAKVSGAGAGRSRAGGIQVVNFFTTENDPNTIAAANQAINDFEAKYPNVHVAMIIISGRARGWPWARTWGSSRSIVPTASSSCRRGTWSRWTI